MNNVNEIAKKKTFFTTCQIHGHILYFCETETVTIHDYCHA